MSNRKEWPIALSQGPSIFEGDGLSRLAASGISRMEVSSGSFDP